MRAPQICSEPGCTAEAAFKTQSRPAWCDDHITTILASSQLEPLEAFVKAAQQRLTRCLRCGCVAHYSLKYTLDLQAQSAGARTCRACFWRQWAGQAYVRATGISEEDARQRADKSGYDYLGPLTAAALENDPHRVECRRCKRITAQRMGDIDWGCTCRSNPTRASPPVNAPAGWTPKRILLKDSRLAGVDWWELDNNEVAVWATATEKTRKEANWRCVYCSHQFTARIIDMAVFPRCPNCEDDRAAQYERYKAIPVADVPELLAAWADDADPTTVTVTGDWEVRQFRCPQGHLPRQGSYSYLTRGCDTCRGKRPVEEIDAWLEGIEVPPHTIAPEIASQWHPTKNGKTKLEALSPNSKRVFWWRDSNCGYEWEDSPKNRNSGHRLRCPACDTILDSLAFHFPEIAAEWSPSNPISAWHVRPTGQTGYLPVWICATSSEHVVGFADLPLRRQWMPRLPRARQVEG